MVEIKLGNEVKRLYTIKDLSELFGVTYRTMQRYVAAKRITGQIIGGKRLFTEEAVNAFLNGGGRNDE